MTAYGIGFLPLIRELQDSHYHFAQPWYADGAGAGGTFERILAHFQDLQAWGPPQGYLPEPTKSILVVSPRNVAKSEELFRGMGMKIVTGSRYLGGLLVDREAEDTWMEYKVHRWEELMETLLGVTHKHPQSAYAVLQKSLQYEWEFVQ